MRNSCIFFAFFTPFRGYCIFSGVVPPASFARNGRSPAVVADLSKHVFQRCRHKWLNQMMLIPCCQAPLHIGFASESTHGYRERAGLGAKLFHEFPSIHIWQPDITQNDIKTREIIATQCCLCSRDGGHFVACPFVAELDER